MAHIQIAIVNHSTCLHNDEVAHAVQAIQIQVNDHFAPVWGVAADLTFYPNRNPPADSWTLVIVDDANQLEDTIHTDALGFHQVSMEGIPIGIIFARTAKIMDSSWSVTASHEILEMLINPYTNLTVFCQKNNYAHILYAHEICDPCQGDLHSYTINGVSVSDFVFPSWFTDTVQHDVQFDYCKKLTRSFQSLPQGFIRIYDFSSPTGWLDYSQNETIDELLIPVCVRGLQRKISRKQWLQHTQNNQNINTQQ